jgi:hypothetical protein
MAASCLAVTVAFDVFEDAGFQNFGIEDGGAYLVDTHGPFAQIDAAAAVAAEGEVFVGGFDQLFAAGAVERFDLRGFGLCRHSDTVLDGFFYGIADGEFLLLEKKAKGRGITPGEGINFLGTGWG